MALARGGAQPAAPSRATGSPAAAARARARGARRRDARRTRRRPPSGARARPSGQPPLTQRGEVEQAGAGAGQLPVDRRHPRPAARARRPARSRRRTRRGGASAAAPAAPRRPPRGARRSQSSEAPAPDARGARGELPRPLRSSAGSKAASRRAGERRRACSLELRREAPRAARPASAPPPPRARARRPGRARARRPTRRTASARRRRGRAPSRRTAAARRGAVEQPAARRRSGSRSGSWRKRGFARRALGRRAPPQSQALEGEAQLTAAAQRHLQLLEREARSVGRGAGDAQPGHPPGSSSTRASAVDRTRRSVRRRPRPELLSGPRRSAPSPAPLARRSSSRASTVRESRCSSASARAARRGAQDPPRPRSIASAASAASAKASSPSPAREHLAEAGVLGDDRPAAGQVAGAAIAEPAAARRDVAALGDAQLGRGAAHELGVGRRACRPPRRGRAAASRCAASASRSRVLVGVDPERQLEAGAAAPRQVDQLAQRVRALAVVDPVVLDRAVAAPVADAGEGVAPRRARSRPASARARPAAGSGSSRARRSGSGRRRCPRAAPDGDEVGVQIEAPCRPPAACQTWLKPGSRSRKARTGIGSSRRSSRSIPEMLSSRSASRAKRDELPVWSAQRLLAVGPSSAAAPASTAASAK